MKLGLVAISLGLMVFNMIGYSSLFQWERYQIKSDVKQVLKAGVPEEDKYHFKFSRKEWQELTWIETNKEFRLGKQFYDIVTFADHGEYISVAAVSDDQETELFVGLNTRIQHMWNQIPPEESPAKTWQQVVSEEYTLSRALASTLTIVDVQHATNWSFHYSLVELQSVWQPPKWS